MRKLLPVLLLPALCTVNSLENKASVFDNESREIIWKLAPVADAALKTFLNNRPALPMLRLLEVYLMQAET